MITDAGTPGTAPPATTTAAALPAELTIYTVGEWRAHWLDQLAALAPAATLQLQAASVAEVDAAGLQALLALDHALLRRDTRLQLLQASAVLRSGCADLGLGDWLKSRCLAATPPPQEQP